MTEPADVSLRARAMLPRGFTDRDAGDLAAAEAMMAKIGEVYALYGFEAVETPFVEYTDALGKFLPDQDRPNEGVFSFKDDDEQWLSLRYDLTAPLARYVAENYDRLPKPYRSYRAGWVFRNEKPGPGRFRQFMQFDADTVGASSPAADAEICMMAADCLEALGIARGDSWRQSASATPRTPGAGSRSCARSTSSIGWASKVCAHCWGPGARMRAAISPRAQGSSGQRSSKCSPF
jgi:histidyl-tRNA synthetase